MAFVLHRLTPIDGEAILTLEECKRHLRVRHQEDDAAIEAYRLSAIAFVERQASTALLPADFRVEAVRFEDLRTLPIHPVQSVISAVHHDSAGTEVAYAPRLQAGRLRPVQGGTWPYENGYASVTFEAGHLDPPDDLIAAVKLMLGHLYSNRSAVMSGGAVEVPLAIDSLISSHRLLTI